MGTIEIEHNGKVYQAEYHVTANIVTVHGDSGSESTQLGGLSEGQVAKLLLRNLARKGYIQPTFHDG
jgi:hypothetical protein